MDAVMARLAAADTAMLAMAGALCILIAALVILLARRGGGRQEKGLERELQQLVQAQSEMQGRMATMAELFGSRQSELNAALGSRLDGLSQRIGTTLHQQHQTTHENLRRLQERLAVIDAAQNNIQSLAKDVVGLQAILSNKQTRGAFGQGRMEAIIADALPAGSFRFQATLSNGTRPDCVVDMPNGAPPLIIDAKFPLESWNAMRAAESDEAARAASQRFRRDLETHLRDIASKYLLPGETQDTAFLFVPSESIFADIHEHYEAVVQRAHAMRVVIVSPTLLLLSIQVVQAVMKDQRMREQAHLIQGEVANLLADLTRLNERVAKLENHFNQARQDVETIRISTGKIARRGERIATLEFETGRKEAEPSSTLDEGQQGLGRMKLRVVDED
ncbi:DNA recombination protein RmuC [Martelella mediterranea]|uniref:DNA recombination protein RmuC homolog n=1 Tax=Martelella mediterranea DSM 17316 TaxID=1122214 RepID=A0A1U9Z5S5_9HYPH|nr:DNA recombination protein RmuC [Martelella mediterranea]AQZ53073.1 DNA recombination protein RmuC [Martelella mediterranea DSM 17316]